MKEGQNGMEPSSITEGWILIQLVFGFSSFLTFLLFLIYGEIKAWKFMLFGCFIAASLSVFCVIWLCKRILDFVNQKLKVEDLTKYRNDYLIGFGAIGMCSVGLEIAVFFVELSEQFNIFTVHFYVVTVSSFYYFFLFPSFDKTCTWIEMGAATRDRYFLTNLFSHLAVLLVSTRIAFEYNGVEKTTIILYQLWCSIFTASTFFDFARVWWVGVQLTNVPRVRNDVAAQPVEPKRGAEKINAKPESEAISKTVAPRPSCNICSFPYTETGIHTPRFLITCGHTICEQCAGKLLNVKCQSLLICPFCQKPTIVNGSAGTLPKNFALLEYTREVVQRNKDSGKNA